MFTIIGRAYLSTHNGEPGSYHGATMELGRAIRELEEDELYRRISALADQVTDFRRCIFNLHVPPYDSQLDIATELDGGFNQVRVGGEPKLIPVGSTAVREAIERYQP